MTTFAPPRFSIERHALVLRLLVLLIACVLPDARASNIFTNTSPLGMARSVHTSTLLPTGKVLAAGGQDNAGYVASVELYDPATGTWSASLLATARIATSPLCYQRQGARRRRPGWH